MTGGAVTPGHLRREIKAPKKMASLPSGLILMSLLVGCQTSQESNRPKAGTASAEIRYRVFETSREAVDRLVPAEKRTGLADSGYWAATVSKAEIQSLVSGLPEKRGVLVDHARTVSWWPRVADMWSYSVADRTVLGGGGGTGFLGVRGQGKDRELRIEYQISHSINARRPLSARVVFEGPASQEGLLLFAPFERQDGTERMHVVAFEIDAWGTPASSLSMQVRPLETAVPASGCEVPLRPEQRWPVVAGYINGRGPFQLVVDTGFTGLCLGTEVAYSAELRLPPSPANTIVGIKGYGGELQTGRPRRVRSLQIGRAEFRQIDGCVANLRALPTVGGAPLDGIVGMAVFADSIVTLDCLHQCLRLYPNDANGALVAPREGGMAARFELEIPYVEVLFHGKPHWLKVDTGSTTGLSVLPSVAQLLRLEYEEGYRTFQALQGPVQSHKAKFVGTVAIGSIQLQNPVILVEPENLIGWEVLKDYILTIDRKRETVSLAAPGSATKGDTADVR